MGREGERKREREEVGGREGGRKVEEGSVGREGGRKVEEGSVGRVEEGRWKKGV